MIDLDEWIERLDEKDTEAEDNDKYQHDIFAEYVLRKNDKNHKLRSKLYNEYMAGTTPLFGDRGSGNSWRHLTCPILAGLISRISLSGSPQNFMRSWMPCGLTGL